MLSTLNKIIIIIKKTKPKKQQNNSTRKSNPNENTQVQWISLCSQLWFWIIQEEATGDARVSMDSFERTVPS